MYPTTEEKTEAFEIMDILFMNGFRDALSYHAEQSRFDSHPWYVEGCWDWREAHKDLLRRLNLEMMSGATKVCIVADGLDWVIKFSFIRETHPHYVETESTENYCEREARYFQIAQKRHLDKYLAATYEVGEIAGVKMFLQERAEPDTDKIDMICQTYIEDNSLNFGIDRESYDSDEAFQEAVSDSASWMEEEDRICAIVGECDELIDFIDEFEINDLHSGNWGTTSDGRIVIFDYSGYNG